MPSIRSLNLNSCGLLWALALPALAACSSVSHLKSQLHSALPQDELRVINLSAVKVTEGPGFPSLGSFNIYERRVRNKGPWQWRGIDALGPPPQSIVSPIFLGGDDLLVSTLGGGLSLMDIKSESSRWTYEVPIGVASRPAVDGSSVFVAGMDAKVRKIRLATGTLEWSTAVSAESLGGITISRGLVFVTTGDDALWTLDEKTGHSLWTYKRPSPEGSVLYSLRGNSIPVISPDGTKVYLGFSDGTFVCLESLSGQTVWERHFERTGRFKDADIPPVMSADGSTIYVSIVDGDLVALKSSDGSSLWSVGGAGSYPAYVDEKEGSLFFSTHNGQVQRISLKNTQLQWTANLKEWGRGSAPVPVGANYLAITTSNGFIVLINKTTGKAVWHLGFAYGIAASPSFDGRRLVVLSARNQLLFYRIEERTL